MSLKTVRLRAITLLDQCEKHAERLDVARKDLHKMGAFDAARLTDPTKEDADRVELVLFGYVRLQDAIGSRLFPALLEAGGELSVESSFVDRLNLLERLGIIQSTESWMELRAIRNQITHDYPEPEVRHQILNQALETISELQQTVVAARHYAAEKLQLRSLKTP